MGFNPRAHGGRDNNRSVISGFQIPVSIHAPTGGATMSQYPIGGHYIVSIHAPTGGATIPPCPGGQRADVSIHAPTGGATNRSQSKFMPKTFQSTRPRGARLCIGSDDGMRHEVSIHAPTGGATVYSLLLYR